MPKFRNKHAIVEACQWFKNGDHPRDECGVFHDEEGKPFQGEGHVVRYFRHPLISGDAMCAQCRQRMHDHGWIDSGGDGQTVCPGDWIVTDANGASRPCKPELFEATYEPVES